MFSLSCIDTCICFGGPSNRGMSRYKRYWSILRMTWKPNIAIFWLDQRPYWVHPRMEILIVNNIRQMHSPVLRNVWFSITSESFLASSHFDLKISYFDFIPNPTHWSVLLQYKKPNPTCGHFFPCASECLPLMPVSLKANDICKCMFLGNVFGIEISLILVRRSKLLKQFMVKRVSADMPFHGY